MQPERLLQTFLDLVTIDAPSGKEGNVAQYCQKALTDLGMEVRFDNSTEQTGSETGNLVAWMPPLFPEGFSENEGQSEQLSPIVLTAHMDCVQPCEGIEPEIVKKDEQDAEAFIRSKGETILASDDKAGVAAILEAIQCIVESECPHRGIVVVFTVCEEIGCIGAKYLEQKLFTHALVEAGAKLASDQPANPDSAPVFESGVSCAVFDSGGVAGTLIVGAPYHYTFTAQITGRASHAGVEPEAGISAITIACEAIASMSWGRLDETTTSNIGKIEGGQVNNIVAQSCTVTGECRSLIKERVEEVKANIAQAFEDATKKYSSTPETSLDLQWNFEYPGFYYNESDALLVQMKEALTKAGLSPIYETTGGGSDANILGSKGVSPVVIGVGMTNFHTVDEYIKIKDLEDSARFATELMKI